METIDCNHQETVGGTFSGEFMIGTCTLCGQVRQFKGDDEYSVVITKLGRIDGKFILPPRGTKFAITPEESRLVREGFDAMQETQEESTFKKELGVLTKDKPIPTPPPTSSSAPAPASETPPVETIEKVIAQPVRHKYPSHRKSAPTKYDKDMEGILADCGRMTDAALEVKWGIARGYFSHLRSKWRARGILVPVYTPAGKEKPAKLTPEQRSEINRRSALARWDKVGAQRDKEAEQEPTPAPGREVLGGGAKINAEDLPDEVLEQLGLNPPKNRAPKMVNRQIPAMGGVLQSLKGLTKRQALWVLRTTIILVRGYSQDKQRNPKTTIAERRKTTVK